MSRYHSYLNSAVTILSQYHGEEPFASFQKKYFSANKRYGSRDRKQVSHLCYCYFRLGKSLMSLPVEERVLTGLFFCSTQPQEILGEIRPEWNEQVTLSLEEKCAFLQIPYSTLNIFPWKEKLSTGISAIRLELSFFVQPDLFLRLRPGQREIVRQKLRQAGVGFAEISESCIALTNTSKIDTVIQVNKEAVIQDHSSQRVGELMTGHEQVRPSVWDCCAASGGKSIMAYDLLPGMKLMVSDIRESILANLKKRFTEAGVKRYRSLVIDLTKDMIPVSIVNERFSMVIADVPCTGSGTWSRTPEQLFYFDEKKIGEYAALQKKIVTHVVPHIEKGGYLLYVTCSIFREENEEAIGFMQEQLALEVKKMEVLSGYDKKADTLFAALLQKNF